MTGTQIGNYRIDEKLGQGGMGTVYRGLEINLDRVVAIKVLHAELSSKANIVERFRTEARAQANLNHPNLAILFAFLEHEGTAMMVMEFVDGENLQEMVRRRGPLPVSEIVPIFKQALQGVGAAHRMGIVHRDLKPGNVMVNKQGIVKVMDFGIAKVAGDHALTRTGVQVGTVYYMSPEQVKSQAVDARTDIYALGVTLYELLTARVPFKGESEFEVLNGHVNTLPELPSVHQSGIPRGIANIVLKALEKKPEDRFQTVEEFSAALDHPERWEGFLPASTAEITRANAPTAEMSYGPWATKASEPVANDPQATIPPIPRPEPVKPAKRFWTSTTVGIASFFVVAAMGGVYLLTSTKPPQSLSQANLPGNPLSNPPVAAIPPKTDATRPAGSATPPPTPATVVPQPEPAAPQQDRPAATVKGRLVIPAKTLVELKLAAPLDSSTALVSQIYQTTVVTPISVNGQTVIPIGSESGIRLTKLTKASKSKPAKLEFEIASLTVAHQPYTVKSDHLEVAANGAIKRLGKFGLGGKKLNSGAEGDSNVIIAPDTPLSFTLKSPLSVTIGR
jgi:serine/threonine protein kinase